VKEDQSIDKMKNKDEQQLLLQLKEVARLCWAKCVAQKARREAEKKAWKKAERQRVMEEDGGVPSTTLR